MAATGSRAASPPGSSASSAADTQQTAVPECHARPSFRAASAGERLEDVVAGVEGGPDVLDVVTVLERVDEAQHLLAGLVVERDGDGGQERHVGGLDGDT